MSDVTITVTFDRQLSDRDTERVDVAVYNLRDIPGVVVVGWCDENGDS